MSGVERQFWESFEGWARRRIAQRLEMVAVLRQYHALYPVRRAHLKAAHGQIEGAREVRLGLSASVARGSAQGLPR
ncbi:hypothetical protein ACTTAI_13235 [Rhodobacter capsulatus]|uniref:hypothetical protein n=1 Tax=Rhodobacter capsulatus TaxID=1061 RepID=UPI0040258B45